MTDATDFTREKLEKIIDRTCRSEAMLEHARLATSHLRLMDEVEAFSRACREFSVDVHGKTPLECVRAAFADLQAERKARDLDVAELAKLKRTLQDCEQCYDKTRLALQAERNARDDLAVVAERACQMICEGRPHTVNLRARLAQHEKDRA